MGIANENFLSLVDRIEEELAKAKALGAVIDYASTPYTDEQLQQLSLLGMRMHMVGTSCLNTADGIAEILADEVKRQRGIDIREVMDNGS